MKFSILQKNDFRFFTGDGRIRKIQISTVFTSCDPLES